MTSRLPPFTSSLPSIRKPIRMTRVVVPGLSVNMGGSLLETVSRRRRPALLRPMTVPGTPSMRTSLDRKVLSKTKPPLKELVPEGSWIVTGIPLNSLELRRMSVDAKVSSAPAEAVSTVAGGGGEGGGETG